MPSRAESSVDGTPRGQGFAIGRNGLITTWNPGANSNVYALTVSGSSVYIGTYGAVAHAAQAPLRRRGHRRHARPRTVAVDGTVYAIAAKGDAIYLRGSFENAGGAPRAHLAVIGTDGTLKAAVAELSSDVYALAVRDDAVVAGGGFNAADGESRGNLVHLPR